MLGVIPPLPHTSLRRGAYVVTVTAFKHRICIVEYALCARPLSARFKVQYHWPQRSWVQSGSLNWVLKTFRCVFAFWLSSGVLYS